MSNPFNERRFGVITVTVDFVKDHEAMRALLSEVVPIRAENDIATQTVTYTVYSARFQALHLGQSVPKYLVDVHIDANLEHPHVVFRRAA